MGVIRIIEKEKHVPCHEIECKKCVVDEDINTAFKVLMTDKEYGSEWLYIACMRCGEVLSRIDKESILSGKLIHNTKRQALMKNQPCLSFLLDNRISDDRRLYD